MKKNIYCFICGKYGAFEKTKTLHFSEKTLVLSINCSKCKNEDGKLFEEEEWNESKNSWSN